MNLKIQIFALLALLQVLLPTIVSSEKILFLLPIATKSHKNVFDPIIKALSARGHHITVAAPFKFSKPLPNVTELVPIPASDLWPTFPDPFEQRKMGRMGWLRAGVMDFVFKACRVAYENPEFMALMDQKFDLIVFNAFINDCFAGMIYRWDTPFISVTAQAAPGALTRILGNEQPASFVPLALLDFSDRMTFVERLINFTFQLALDLLGPLIIGKHEAIYREYLGEDIPGAVDICKNVSLILSNSYYPLTFPRPLLPQVIEVGGMHCGPGKALPKDLDQWVSEAKDGFIVFSLGSVVNTDQMKEEMRLKFLNVFAKLKQRVLWKWNSGSMDGLPPNVRVSKWLPQQDLLGHPNIKLFITHGGLLSTQEAAYHGVPLLGIPVFADQDLNMKQAERGGYAKMMEVLDFTEESFEGLIRELLTEPKYAEKARELSAVIKDQIVTPVERAVYYTEYVMRHKGAHHMKSAARDLNFWQFHSLDVVATLAGGVLTVLSLVVFLVMKCFRKVCGRSKGQKVSAGKKAQ